MVDADSMTEPISLPLSRGALDLTPSRLVSGATSVIEDEVQQRLALWLAEVAAEAAMARLQAPGRPDGQATTEPTSR
jgi:hypothetical protein